jgi:hypothetical protein
MISQACKRVFMVRPAAFGYNAETAATNGFQRPDAVFPNNWVGLHDHGIRVYYPMLAKNRRQERNHEVIAFLDEQLPAKQIRDYTAYEIQDLAMEGTGSLIFDYLNKRVFASVSPRTEPEIMQKISNDLGFEPILFDAFDMNGHAYYHTNVILSIGTKYALICADAIPEDQREKVLESLSYPERTIIPITRQQVDAFAGNVLEISNSNDELLIVISQTAVDSLRDEQIAVLQRSGLLLIANIPVIESIGGGGVRCMLAEIRD